MVLLNGGVLALCKIQWLLYVYIGERASAACATLQASALSVLLSRRVTRPFVGCA